MSGLARILEDTKALTAGFDPTLWWGLVQRLWQLTAGFYPTLRCCWCRMVLVGVRWVGAKALTCGLYPTLDSGVQTRGVVTSWDLEGFEATWELALPWRRVNHLPYSCWALAWGPRRRRTLRTLESSPANIADVGPWFEGLVDNVPYIVGP